MEETFSSEQVMGMLCTLFMLIFFVIYTSLYLYCLDLSSSYILKYIVLETGVNPDSGSAFSYQKEGQHLFDSVSI